MLRITYGGEDWLGFLDLWSGQKLWWNLCLTPVVNFGEVRRAQLAKSTLLASSLVPLGSFKVCSDAKERVWCGMQREATAPFKSLVKLQPWFLRLRWKTCLRQNCSLGFSASIEGPAFGKNTLKMMYIYVCVCLCIYILFRLWGLLEGAKLVKFCIGTHVRKHTASPVQTKYNHITCCSLPHLLLTVRCFSSGSTYKKTSLFSCLFIFLHMFCLLIFDIFRFLRK